MAGLVPAIHAFVGKRRKQDVDHRDKPGDDGWCPHTTGFTPGSAVTRSRNLAPRISKLRYWSNDAQAGDSNTTGSASPEASASRAELATATSSVAANSLAASPIR